jgi:hypothetical protein
VLSTAGLAIEVLDTVKGKVLAHMHTVSECAAVLAYWQFCAVQPKGAHFTTRVFRRLNAAGYPSGASSIPVLACDVPFLLLREVRHRAGMSPRCREPCAPCCVVVAQIGSAFLSFPGADCEPVLAALKDSKLAAKHRAHVKKIVDRICAIVSGALPRLRDIF